MKTRKCFFATPSLTRRETTGRNCSKKHLSCVEQSHSDSSRSPPLQAMSGSSLVEGRWDIPARRGVEEIFSSDKKDAKVFRKIVGAINLVMEN